MYIEKSVTRVPHVWLCLGGTIWETPGKLLVRRDEGQVQRVGGIYLPHWLLLHSVRTVINGTASREHHWHQGLVSPLRCGTLEEGKQWENV